jgi:hypothetical protein
MQVESGMAIATNHSCLTFLCCDKRCDGSQPTKRLDRNDYSCHFKTMHETCLSTIYRTTLRRQSRMVVSLTCHSGSLNSWRGCCEDSKRAPTVSCSPCHSSVANVSGSEYGLGPTCTNNACWTRWNWIAGKDIKLVGLESHCFCLCWVLDNPKYGISHVQEWTEKSCYGTDSSLLCIGWSYVSVESHRPTFFGWRLPWTLWNDPRRLLIVANPSSVWRGMSSMGKSSFSL